MVHNWTMSDIHLNIHEAKTHLSRHLHELLPEDRIILCNRNRPVAEVRLLPQASGDSRRLGVAKGEFIIPETFWDPLPEAVIDAFEGAS